MILYGQFDSAFVRRVGIALELYGIDYAHRPWSVFGDAEKLRAVHPLGRVPTLQLDDGTALADSHIILGYLDRRVGRERALMPRADAEWLAAARVISLATGILDKGVSRFYEKALHTEVSDTFYTRMTVQMQRALDALEVECAQAAASYWFGEAISHADIASAAMMRHMTASHPDLFSLGMYPSLEAHAARMEALPVFQKISQPFIPPA